MLQIQCTACDCMRVHKMARKCKRVHDGARDGTTFTCRGGGRIGLVGPPNSPNGLPAYSHDGAMLNEGVVVCRQNLNKYGASWDMGGRLHLSRQTIDSVVLFPANGACSIAV